MLTAGVTHLAMETSAQPPLDEAARTGQVTTATDPFAFEPQRAALLRVAVGAGVPIAAFDVDGDDHAWMQAHPDEAFLYRERRMADHIVERILDPNPNARVLIWVGYGHAQKGVRMNVKMMAQHLWELTGVEPYSAYQLTGEGRRPGVDIIVRHPEPQYVNGRPDWLRSPDRRSAIDTVDRPGEYLVQLHLASEGAAGAPVDQLLTGPDGRFELLAPAGVYLLRLWSPDGAVVHERPLPLDSDRHGVLLTP